MQEGIPCLPEIEGRWCMYSLFPELHSDDVCYHIQGDSTKKTQLPLLTNERSSLLFSSCSSSRVWLLFCSITVKKRQASLPTCLLAVFFIVWSFIDILSPIRPVLQDHSARCHFDLWGRRGRMELPRLLLLLMMKRRRRAHPTLLSFSLSARGI